MVNLSETKNSNVKVFFSTSKLISKISSERIEHRSGMGGGAVRKEFSVYRFLRVLVGRVGLRIGSTGVIFTP